MNKFSSVWVFSDTPSRLPELMNGAQALGENVNTFVLSDAPRDKCAHFREINGIAAAFQYLQKNYNPTAPSSL